MTSAEHAALVTELIRLKQVLADIEEKKDAIQARLLEEAQACLKADGHKTFVGCQYTFTAADGAIARVTFPRDQTIRQFQFNDANEAYRTIGTGRAATVLTLPGLRRHAGEHFDKLFTTHHKPAKAFHELCGALLGPASRDKLIDLCTEPSSPRVTTETSKAP